jgi:hypothetical protein
MGSGTSGRAFIIMPFGRKKGPNDTEVDFDAIFNAYLKPAVEAAGLRAHRADADQRSGSIHADMFQDLLLAEFVVADLTIDNPNVWYELGVRHALRSSGAVLTYALRDRLPFDVAGQRMQRYTVKAGVPDPDRLENERTALTEAITATLGAWRGRKASPVYAQLPNLKEPDWKTLKVGDVNEFWEALEKWQSRIEIARRKQRPGDILVLAEETPNRTLEFEALRTAAKALIDLKRPRYALAVLERARSLDPDDFRCRQLEAIAFGRDGRFEDAREALRALADKRRDGETLGLLARTWKDQWTRLWMADSAYQTDKLAAARNTAATLAQAAEAYVKAFQEDPANTYPGINALLLARLWEHVVNRKCRFDLTLIASGVRWAASCALARDKTYWTLVTLAEQALLESDGGTALDNYGEAAALAVANTDAFALDSSSQTLDFLRELGFQTNIVTEAATIIDNAERQLQGLVQVRHEQQVAPERVVLFSGHMVDKPGRTAARLPEAKMPQAAARIGQELDRIGVAPGDLGISQAASGGDLLFAHACLARGMRLEIYLPQREPEFLAASVSFGASHWQEDFDAIKNRPDVLFRVMPDELGATSKDLDIYDRCNKWMLHSALSCGLSSVRFITLWDGAPGDGPGGTEHMVGLVRRLTGREPANIDPATL